MRLVRPEYVTRQELAEMMGVSVKTVDRMKQDGLPYVSWGRRLVRFDPQVALSWSPDRKNAS
jgi:phage terminase Nu1 subunit (DNA packaging protein)